MSAMARPPHIVIDGPDGVGISTQCGLLAEYLRARGIACTQTANPSEGPTGILLREMLLHKVQAIPPAAMQRLYVTDRVANNELVVEPARARGAVVVQSRGEWSTVVYNAARADWLDQADALALEAFEWHRGIEIPTLTILLVADLEVTEARRRARGAQPEFFDASDFQARVIALYGESARLADIDPRHRYVAYARERERLFMVDASGSAEAVAELILNAIEQAGLLSGLFGETS